MSISIPNQSKSEEVVKGRSFLYPWYVVSVLTFIYVISFIDRLILNVIVEPIRLDLNLTDIEIGLINGTSFAVFYTLLALPCGRLADLVNRKMLILGGLAIWSVLTLLSAFSNSFWELFIFRMGVGLGEAALTPAAFSIISDYFSKGRCGSALSLYGTGIYIGIFLVYSGGGLLYGFVEELINSGFFLQFDFFKDLAAWRIVLFSVGLPSLLACIIVMTVREPQRDTSASGAADRKASLREVIDYLKDHWQIFACHFTTMSMVATATYVRDIWNTSFFLRTHNISLSEVNFWYGLIALSAGVTGILTGGRVCDYLSAKGVKAAPIKALLFSVIFWMPFGFLYVLVPSWSLSLGLIFPTVFFASVSYGINYFILQEVMPARMRGIGISLMLIVTNIMGLGAGPIVVAYLTDHVFGDPSMIRYSMFTSYVILYAFAVTALLKAGRFYQSTAEAAKNWH